MLFVMWLSRSSQKAARSKIHPKGERLVDDSHGICKSANLQCADDNAVVAATNNGYIINPQSTFPLTIYNVDRETAIIIKKLLDTKCFIGNAQELVPVILKTNLRCKEIEDYINTFKPQYFRKIEELKQSSSEWQSASEKDKEDLLAYFREQAIESLDIRPYCDLEVLFECEPEDFTIDDALLERYGYDVLQVYLKYAGDINKVRILPAGHFERKKFDRLVELGLAINGYEIDSKALLSSLTLKQLNEIAASLQEKPFSRKSKAIEFLASLPDVRGKVGTVIALREVFQLRPLPPEFSHIDLKKISDIWCYVSEIAELITHTYHMGNYAKQDMQNNLSLSVNISEWKILTAGDSSCPYCKRAALKVYPANQYPRVPLHIGCRCTVIN